MWRNLQSNAPHCRNGDQAKLRMENRIAQERKEGQERRPVIKYVSVQTSSCLKTMLRKRRVPVSHKIKRKLAQKIRLLETQKRENIIRGWLQMWAKTVRGRSEDISRTTGADRTLHLLEELVDSSTHQDLESSFHLCQG